MLNFHTAYSYIIFLIAWYPCSILVWIFVPITWYFINPICDLETQSTSFRGFQRSLYRAHLQLIIAGPPKETNPNQNDALHSMDFNALDDFHPFHRFDDVPKCFKMRKKCSPKCLTSSLLKHKFGGIIRCRLSMSTNSVAFMIYMDTTLFQFHHSFFILFVNFIH